MKTNSTISKAVKGTSTASNKISSSQINSAKNRISSERQNGDSSQETNSNENPETKNDKGEFAQNERTSFAERLTQFANDPYRTAADAVRSFSNANNLLNNPYLLGGGKGGSSGGYGGGVGGGSKAGGGNSSRPRASAPKQKQNRQNDNLPEYRNENQQPDRQPEDHSPRQRDDNDDTPDFRKRDDDKKSDPKSEKDKAQKSPEPGSPEFAQEALGEQKTKDLAAKMDESPANGPLFEELGRRLKKNVFDKADAAIQESEIPSQLDKGSELYKLYKQKAEMNAKLKGDKVEDKDKKEFVKNFKDLNLKIEKEKIKHLADQFLNNESGLETKKDANGNITSQDGKNKIILFGTKDATADAIAAKNKDGKSKLEELKEKYASQELNKAAYFGLKDEGDPRSKLAKSLGVKIPEGKDFAAVIIGKEGKAKIHYGSNSELEQANSDFGKFLDQSFDVAPKPQDQASESQSEPKQEAKEQSQAKSQEEIDQAWKQDAQAKKPGEEESNKTE